MFKVKSGLKNMTPSSSCLCLNHKQKITFFQSSNTVTLKPFFTKLTANNLVSSLGRVAILFYQATFSYFLGGNCRFYPSCSHYGLEAFSKYSFLMAFKLTFLRICNCHPLTNRGVFDPVPLNYLEKSSQ